MWRTFSPLTLKTLCSRQLSSLWVFSTAQVVPRKHAFCQACDYPSENQYRDTGWARAQWGKHTCSQNQDVVFWSNFFHFSDDKVIILSENSQKGRIWFRIDGVQGLKLLWWWSEEMTGAVGVQKRYLSSFQPSRQRDASWHKHFLFSSIQVQHDLEIYQMGLKNWFISIGYIFKRKLEFCKTFRLNIHSTSLFPNFGSCYPLQEHPKLPLKASDQPSYASVLVSHSAHLVRYVPAP